LISAAGRLKREESRLQAGGGALAKARQNILKARAKVWHGTAPSHA